MDDAPVNEKAHLGKGEWVWLVHDPQRDKDLDKGEIVEYAHMNK